MTTAPSETRKATGMLPLMGGLRGTGGACGLAAPERSAAPAHAAREPRAEPGTAAIKPSAVDLLSSSLLFIGPPMVLRPAFSSRERRGGAFCPGSDVD